MYCPHPNAARRPVLPPSPRPSTGRQAEQPASRTSAGSATVAAYLPAGGPSAALQDWNGLVARVDALPSQVRDMAARSAQGSRLPGQPTARISRPPRRASPWTRGARLCSLGRGGKASRQRHVLRRHHPRRRSEDALDAQRTRAARSRRARRAVLQVTEYFHPRVEEFCGTMPAGLGHYIEDGRTRRLHRPPHQSRPPHPHRQLFRLRHALAGRRPAPLAPRPVAPCRSSRRISNAGTVWRSTRSRHDYALAVEILECRRLIKGYSDTHVARSRNSTACCPPCRLAEGRPDAADWLRRLREAALKDEKGDLLDGALKTVATLNQPSPAPSQNRDRLS